MKLISIFLIALFSIGNSVFSNPITKAGKVTFHIKKGFGTIHGEFNKIDYHISIDKNDLGTINGTAHISSLSTGNATRDKHLQNKEWFDATHYPEIKIQSTKIVQQKEEVYLGTFEITIKGKTQTQEIPFQVVTNGDSKLLKATFTLSIGTFNIGGGVLNLLVGDKVTVNINLSF